MSRTIRPGPRPFAAIGASFFVVFLILGLLGAPITGRDLVVLMGVPLVLFALISMLVLTSSVRVGTENIETSLLGYRRRIPFHEISHSVPRVLVEKDHPVGLDIYRSGANRPAITVSLKSFRKSDVAWLLALPQLKVSAK